MFCSLVTGFTMALVVASFVLFFWSCVHVPEGRGAKAKPKLIGLCGYARTGKDEAAAVICKRGGWVRVSFADPIREALFALDPLVPSARGCTTRLSSLVRADGWEKAKKRPEVRRLLQLLGTEAGRDVLGRDIWINIAYRKVSEAQRQGKNVIITDVRFSNEAEAVRAWGGEIVRITRKGTGAINSHQSDKGVAALPAEHHLANEGSVLEWRRKVDKSPIF